VASVPGWPPVLAPETGRTDLYVLPLEAFPASFAAELAAWQAAMRGDDLLADNGPGRPLRPATVQHQTRILRRFASALAHQGVAPAAITGLADLVRPEHVKRGLRFFLDRHGGKPSPGTTGMADVLLTLARRWLRAEEAQLRELQAIAKRIVCRQAGLTASNRARLIQFDDPRNIRRLLDLPRQLVERSGGLPDAAAARLVQSALAIAILLAAPLRLRNLAQLNLHRHVVRTGRGARASVRLVIEREETKNREVLDYPLPNEAVRLLDRYLRHHRRHLLVGEDQGWLFPGLAGRAREQGGLAKQIQKAVRAHTGLVVHVHLFRHLAGKLSLLVDAGNYEQVRRLLGHRSITTTTTFYTGFATDAAARRYHQQVLQLSGPAANQAAAVRQQPKPRPAADEPELGRRPSVGRPGRRRG
jgi:integrase